MGRLGIVSFGDNRRLVTVIFLGVRNQFHMIKLLPRCPVTTSRMIGGVCHKRTHEIAQILHTSLQRFAGFRLDNLGPAAVTAIFGINGIFGRRRGGSGAGPGRLRAIIATGIV